MRYILYYTQPGDIVFDGFAGTGMTGVACGKCSDKNEVSKYQISGKVGIRHCICGDLSPIASFISYNFNNPVSNKLLKFEASQLLQKAREELGYLYKTKHTNGDYGNISYVIWSDQFVCENCGGSYIYWNQALNENLEFRDAIVCPHCHSKVSKSKDLILKETETSANGNLITIPSKVPVLINYEYNKKKYFKVPDKEDLELIESIKTKKISSFIPLQEIPDGVKTRELLKAGYKDVSDLYTKRNLLVFSYLWNETKGKPILRFCITAILVKTGSLLHNVGIKKGKINLAGALPNALFVPSILAERNIFNLFEGKVEDIINLDPEHLHRCVNMIQSATSIEDLKSSSVDYIFTDPPFGHNLMYSELNFIHEGWLNLFTNNKDEAIENSSQHKSVDDYMNLMTSSFEEYYRILKPGKWMTVEFSNTSASIWNAIQRALDRAGFIVSVVRGLDKQQGSFNAQTTTTAVKQDLVISCYKPSENLVKVLKVSQDKRENVWDFIGEHLQHLPVHIERGNATTTVIERSPKILYDRLISYYVQHGYSIPMDAQQFQQGLRERFLERDGMFFTAHQAAEYEEKKAHTSEFVPMGLIVSDEANGIEWLKHELKEPKTYQEISPEWMAAINGQKKGDVIPELKTILEENFIEDEQGKWHIPDLEKAIDLEKLHHKSLMREFNLYKEQAQKPRARIREVRVEALREGFKECFKDKDFQTILLIADKIPQNILTEDEQLLQYYDIASMRA
jgi:DNA-directed RNA polymerase subunit RPC12/RpoP